MAVHSFVCDECKVEVKDTTSKGIHICPKCGEHMRWNLNIAIHGNYKRPIHSDALAIHPDQRAEHERKFPYIKLDKQNRPIFDNFVRHERYLKETGFVKETQKIRTKTS